ncbi:transcriptional regulatory protein SrrA [Oxobacter pfennigii]|uniref:Stage 0 sporulation protein A homolog n=1 Tax=Oxobacter pfennigii TaxID=36849 RepID=A0A0P9AG32_9CLOT|nr:response regulator transcription factor [Oxobacter pfennigii]KPU44348.1 transcriptional regulatory protein SrrA [Oxobacter pfennigii]
MINILLIEDDLDLQEIIKFYLEQENKYKVTVAHSAEDALQLVDTEIFNIILCDIMLPGMDGINLCAQLRRAIYCPIIFISCLADEDNIIHALKMGGDDYIVKPFSYKLLIAHIEANLRRTDQSRPRGERLLCVEDFILDTHEHTIDANGQRHYLSPTEYEILYYMMNNPNTILDMEEIYQYIWHRPSYGDTRTITVHISNLRKKLELDSSKPRYIKTVRNLGYIFCPDPE